MLVVVKLLVRRYSIFSVEKDEWKTILLGFLRESVHPRTFCYHPAETARKAVHKIQIMPRPANN